MRKMFATPEINIAVIFLMLIWLISVGHLCAELVREL